MSHSNNRRKIKIRIKAKKRANNNLTGWIQNAGTNVCHYTPRSWIVLHYFVNFKRNYKIIVFKS